MKRVMSDVDIDNARFYPVKTARGTLWLPSVTSLLSVWPKPALVNWSASSEKQGILADLEGYLHENETASRGEMLARVLKLKAAPLRYREVSRSAKDIGSSAHAWIEWKLHRDLGKVLGPEPALLPGAERATIGAEAWMVSVNLKPIAMETRVVDTEHGYAGRYDLKAEVDWTDGLTKERRVVILDWKTAKGIYPDMKIQNAAYRQADARSGDAPKSKGGVIVRLAKTEDDPVPFEAVQVPFDPTAFDTFRAAIQFWSMWRGCEGKWTGGYATDDEIAQLQAGNRRRKKSETAAPTDKKWMQASFEKAGL